MREKNKVAGQKSCVNGISESNSFLDFQDSGKRRETMNNINEPLWKANKKVEPTISKSKHKEVKVEFKLYSTTGELHQKFVKTMEFFEHDDTNSINEELKEIGLSYEGHEQETYICKYKILSIRVKIVEWKLKENSFCFRRTKESYLKEKVNKYPPGELEASCGGLVMQKI